MRKILQIRKYLNQHTDGPAFTFKCNVVFLIGSNWNWNLLYRHYFPCEMFCFDFKMFLKILAIPCVSICKILKAELKQNVNKVELTVNSRGISLNSIWQVHNLPVTLHMCFCIKAWMLGGSLLALKHFTFVFPSYIYLLLLFICLYLLLCSSLLQIVFQYRVAVVSKLMAVVAYYREWSHFSSNNRYITDVRSILQRGIH